MKKNINEAFTSEESKEIYDKFLTIVGTRRDNLVKKYGNGAEQVAYATAVNQVKKKAANIFKLPNVNEKIENTRLKEMIKSALQNNNEKSLKEENRGLADIEEDGYNDAQEAIKMHFNKGQQFKNSEDFKFYKKGFLQGIVDEVRSFLFDNNID